MMTLIENLGAKKVFSNESFYTIANSNDSAQRHEISNIITVQTI